MKDHPAYLEHKEHSLNKEWDSVLRSFYEDEIEFWIKVQTEKQPVYSYAVNSMKKNGCDLLESILWLDCELKLGNAHMIDSTLNVVKEGFNLSSFECYDYLKSYSFHYNSLFLNKWYSLPEGLISGDVKYSIFKALLGSLKNISKISYELNIEESENAFCEAKALRKCLDLYRHIAISALKIPEPFWKKTMQNFHELSSLIPEEENSPFCAKSIAGVKKSPSLQKRRPRTKTK